MATRRRTNNNLDILIFFSSLNNSFRKYEKAEVGVHGGFAFHFPLLFVSEINSFKTNAERPLFREEIGGSFPLLLLFIHLALQNHSRIENAIENKTNKKGKKTQMQNIQRICIYFHTERKWRIG